MTAFQVGGKALRQAGAGYFACGGLDIVVHASQCQGVSLLLIQTVGGAIVQIAGLADGTGVDEVAAILLEGQGEGALGVVYNGNDADLALAFAEDGGAVGVTEETDVPAECSKGGAGLPTLQSRYDYLEKKLLSAFILCM